MIFQSFYNRYYKIIDRLLTQATDQPLSKADISKAIRKDGFAETPLVLMPALADETCPDAYPLLRKLEDGTFVSRLKHAPTRPFTEAERRWLKSQCADPTARALLSTPTYEKLNALLADETPLYEPTDFLWHSQAANKDSWESPTYQQHFQLLQQAIEASQVVLIHYSGAKGTKLSTYYLPHRLEYSQRDGKTRVLVTPMKRQSFHRLMRLNVSRIERIELTDRFIDKERRIYKRKCTSQDLTLTDSETLKKPLTRELELEVSNFRNGIERCFYQFSIYTRTAVYDENSGLCRLNIDYLPSDEAELMIQVLSFGPAVKVIGPESFKAALIERLNWQECLF